MSDDPRPYKINRFSEVADTLSALRSDPRITNLYHDVQSAQVALAEADPDNPHARDNPGIPWISGSGNCSSPSDDPPYQLEQDKSTYTTFDDVPINARDLPYPRGSVVRIGLWADHDHRHDRLPVAGAHVYAAGVDRSTARSLASIINTTTGLPDAIGDYTTLEGQMLDDLATDIFGDPTDPTDTGAIGHIAAALGEDEVPIHLVLFDHHTHQCLTEATARHRDRPAVNALHDLLALRSGIETGDLDEPMVTILQDDLQNHVALPHPNYGLIGAFAQLFSATYAQFTDSDTCDWASPHLLAPPWAAPNDHITTPDIAWRRLNADDEWVSLLETFHWQFFDRRPVAMKHSDGGLLPDYVPNVDTHGDTVWVPTRVDLGSQLPLAYVWFALRELAPNSGLEQRARDTFGDIQDFSQYAYQHPPGGRVDPPALGRLTRADITLLARRLAHVVATIERLLTYRSSDVATAKTPRTPASWATVDLGGANLTRGAREFLEQEHHAAEADALDHIGQPIPDRVAAGESTIVHATTKPRLHNDIAATLSGALTPSMGTEPGLDTGTAHDWLDDPDRLHDHLQLDEGDWVVLHPLTDDGSPAVPWGDKPDKLKHGLLATIDELNRETGRVTLTALNTDYLSNDIPDRFSPWHLQWYGPDEAGNPPTDTDDEPFRVFLTEDTHFLVDPSVDGVPTGRAYTMLDSANPPELMSLFEDIASTDTVPTGTGLNADYNEWIINALDATAGTTGLNTPPLNEAQKDAGTTTAPRLVWVQGPFGSGKSSSALSTAVVAHAIDRAYRGLPAVIVVSVPSNTSGDEIAADIGRRAEQARRTPVIDGADDLLVARVASGDPEINADEFEELAYCGYASTDHDTYYGSRFDPDSPISLVQHRLQARATPTPIGHETPDPSDGGPLIVVATPSKLWGLLDRLFTGEANVGRGSDADVSLIALLAAGATDASLDYSPQALAHFGTHFFDGFAADEASQHSLAKAGIPGAFLAPTSQAIIGGDHRQLSMVQQYDWDEESRETVMGVGGHLSLMDYARLADGQTVPSVDRDDLQYSFAADIPYVGLNVCYRCNQTITQFCRPVYKEDGIELRVNPDNPTKRARPPTPQTDAMATALAPDWPLVTLTHDDRSGRATSQPEADLVAEAVAGLHDDDSVGVVVAHTDQRALIRDVLAAHPEVDSADVKVDTADGFQGGERDTILVSLSASEPDYISDEEEFILIDNRTLVALTRARSKVVLVASDALLSNVPDDPDLYDRALLLRNLATATDAADRLALNHAGRAGTPLASNQVRVPNIESITVEKVRQHSLNEFVPAPTTDNQSQQINMYRFKSIEAGH